MADSYDEDVPKDSKFAHLLKPIRDLAENWSIDIANELEEYLVHLDRVNFSFEDGGQMLDFAEAALLIQSSACVYSKKVEHLHNLVYQTLDAVRSKKKALAANGQGDDLEEQGNGETVAGGKAIRAARNAGHDLEDDTVEAFLHAGANLKEVDDIDLSLDDDTSTVAYVRPPASLLALEDQAGTAGTDGDAGFYRLAHCFVHASGALLLDARDGDSYNVFLQRAPQASGSMQGQQQQHQQQAAPMHARTVPVGEKDAILDNDQNIDHGRDMSDDDDNGNLQGGSMPMECSQFQGQATEKLGKTVAASLQPGTGLAADTAAAAAAGPAPAAAGMQPVAGPAGANDPMQGNYSIGLEQDDDDYYDPYKPLDFDEKGPLPLKPMQIRKPTRSRHVAAAAAAKRASQQHPGGSAAGLCYAEFAYGAELVPRRQQLRQHAAQSRHAKQQQQQQQQQAIFDWSDAAAAAAALQDGAAGMGQEGPLEGDEADWQQAVVGAAGFDDEDDNEPIAFLPDAGDGIDNMHGGGRQLLNMMEDAVHAGHAGMEAANAGANGPSYEDLCRAHIDGMLAAAAAQEVQSELAKRVSGWRSRIDPVLQQEESRPAFDIQHYGEKLLSRLVEKEPDEADASSGAQPVKKQVVDFHTVAAELDKYEVSRMFAAMLQLINNRNVAIHRANSNCSPDAPFELELLSSELPHKALAEGLTAHNNSQQVAEQQEQMDTQEGLENLVAPKKVTAATRASKKAKANG